MIRTQNRLSAGTILSSPSVGDFLEVCACNEAAVNTTNNAAATTIFEHLDLAIFLPPLSVPLNSVFTDLRLNLLHYIKTPIMEERYKKVQKIRPIAGDEGEINTVSSQFWQGRWVKASSPGPQVDLSAHLGSSPCVAVRYPSQRFSFLRASAAFFLSCSILL